MPAQEQSVIHPAGLAIIQGGQVGESWRLGLVENRPRQGLKGAPAGPV